MKTISIVIPCFNEEENINDMYNAINNLFNNELNKYNYELIFIDNGSTDNTKNIINNICDNNKNVKAIFNIKNFGVFNSSYYGLLQSSGDASILMACDFQEPVELIPEFIKEWENGHKIVVGVKNKSQENKFIYLLRSIYYKLIKKLSNVEMISHYTGFGLYDKDFINILTNLKDSTPFLRGVVAEYGYDIKEINYIQPKRKKGKSHNGFAELYDGAMQSFTTYTTLGLRLVTLSGFIIAIICFIIGLIYLIYKLLHWYNFDLGMAPMLIGVYFIGAVILCAVGLIGEYIIAINKRSMQKPLVIEKERKNFDE